jgi:endonuclease G
MNKLTLLLLTFLTFNAYAWDQRDPLPQDSCKIHSPYGFSQPSKAVQPICREAYFVAYDAPAKIPVYVAYTLEPKNALGCFPRTNAFVADKSITGGATPSDYVSTGYDKGHAAPDGDLSWTQQVEYESFLMTNMYPQLPGFNRSTWKLLETTIRGWAVQLNNPYTIYVGGVYDEQDKKIGNGVVVPHAFYKIVINNQTNEVAGWWFPHTERLGTDLTKFRRPVKEIQQDIGFKFAFPLVYKELAVGQEWKVDFGALTKAKRTRCGITASID